MTTETGVDEILRELLDSTYRQLELAGMDASPAALRAVVIERLRSRCAQLGVTDMAADPCDALAAGQDQRCA